VEPQEYRQQKSVTCIGKHCKKSIKKKGPENYMNEVGGEGGEGGVGPVHQHHLAQQQQEFKASKGQVPSLLGNMMGWEVVFCRLTIVL
jgi:hypothetical protein